MPEAGETAVYANIGGGGGLTAQEKHHTERNHGRKNCCVRKFHVTVQHKGQSEKYVAFGNRCMLSCSYPGT